MVPIVHLITSLNVGGAQRMVVKILERMDLERFPSRVISLIDGGAMECDVRALGVPVQGLGMRKGIPNPNGLFRLRRALLEYRPCILQTWLYQADIMGTLAAYAARVPHVFWNLRGTPRDSVSRSWLESLNLRISAALSGWPDAVLVNSKEGREAHKNLGYRPKRWEWIPNGFDLSVYRRDAQAGRQIREELGLDAHTLVAGCLSRWHPMKDHANLLAAVAQLDASRPVDLLLAGEGMDEQNPELAKLIDRFGLRRRVHCVGARRDIHRLLAGLDFVISSSRCGEGFPNVLGEAMACETPCVTTNAGDSAFVVGDTGFVVPTSDSSALAAGIQRMVNLETEQRRTLGAQARMRIDAEFRIESIVDRYVQLYDDVA